MVKSSVPEDNTQDAMVLLEYYREHKPELATEAKVAQIIQTFRAKAGATAKASINSIGPSWRELMYDSITKRSGVDPREFYDLAIGSAVARKATTRQRQRTEAATATRRLAWDENNVAQQERELPLTERKERDATQAAGIEREMLERPWKHHQSNTISVTVPPDGYPGKRLTVKLPSGVTVYPVVPENCPPGQTFSASAVPPPPDVRSIGGGHRVMVDTGREPYAKQFEVLAEPLNPAHPSMPHIDRWHEPQYNPAKPGGAAESEYGDRYLGFWREDTELNKGSYFARLPESRKVQPWPEQEFPAQDFFFSQLPSSSHPLQAEHGSKRAEMRRALDGNHGTLQGPHADMLLQDSLNADKAADERTLFKNRQSTMLSRSRKGGAAAGEGQRTQQAITLLKRYTLVEGGTGGQGCELQICRGDLTKVGTEALVTPASPDLSSGGMGVNSRVHSAAGAVFSRLVARVPEVSPGLRCDTGSAVATPSGELAVAKVIHAVAPVHPKAPLWHEMVYSGKHARHSDPPLGVPRNYRNYEDYQVPGLLAGAHSAAMALVNKHGLSTFSIPALSCDVGGYPPVEAAEIALKAVLDRTNVGGIELIQFVLPDPPNQHVENAWLKEAARQVRFGKLTAARRGRDPRTGEEADAGATADAGSDGDDGTGSEMLEEQQELLRAFREFDRDGDGTVTPAEFRQGLNRCDIDIPKANLMKMVEKLSDQKLDSVWNTIDQDGSGDMDASELQTVLTTMGNKMSEADVGRLARKLDRDHDGTISKTEFRKWWARQPAHAKEKMVSIEYADFVSTFDPLENALRRIFNDIDESNDGALDAQEIWRLCRDMGAELDARELKEAMREMDGDGSGEVDFEEFYAWITAPRKHSRKLAKAMSEFRSKRLAGGARQERPYGRPTAGRAGDETFNRAKEAYLPHMITRKKQPASAAITQLDEEYYDRQQHAGVLLGEPAVTVKPGQQAGAGTRESHYEGPRGAAVGKRDPNGYIPYKPHEPIIAASLEKLMEKLPLADKSLAPVWKEIDRRLIETGELDAEALPSVLNTVGQSPSDSDVAAIGRKLVRRKGKVASLRKEFEGMHVGALKQRALSVGVDKEMVATWWSGPASQGPLSRGVGMQTSSTVPKNANEDDHYTLVPPWQGEEDDYREGREQKEGQLNRISNARIGRYIGLLKDSEEVNVKEDLAGIQEHNEQLHTWIDPRSCWVGGIPRKHASERAMRKIFDEHGMSAVSITVRVKNRVTSVRGTPSVANRSWALVEFVDKNTAMRARKAKVMVDDDSGRAVALKVREAQVEQQLAKSRAQAEQEKTTRLARSMAEDAAVEEGEIERVTVEYPLNEGGWGAASRWPEGSRDESGQPQGRMTYPVKDGTDEPLTKGRWVGGSADSRNGFKATVEQRGRAGNTAPPGGVSKQTDKWGNPQYAPPERPKAKSSVHQEVIDAIIQTVPASRAAAKRKELGNIKVRELREKAEAAGVDSATLEKWWSVVGEKMASEKVSQARHLQVHWNKRYIGMNPDEPFAGWGEKPGQRDKLRYS